MFKVNNKDTRATNGVVLASSCLIMNISHSIFSVFIVNLEHVIANWDSYKAFAA